MGVEFVVFDCGSEGRKTMMFHQEAAMVQPACGEVVCSVDQVVAAYSAIASADFNSICSVGPEGPEGSGKPSGHRRPSGPRKSSGPVDQLDQLRHMLRV